MAASPRFFLSYARNDRPADVNADAILAFYTDLSGVLRQRLGVPRGEEPGFLDSEGIEPGTEWPDRLRDALRTAAAFVPILSPAYFNSRYCGKEWAAFASRLSGIRQNPVEPGLIQPVLLTPPTDLRPIPEAVRALQYQHGNYPQAYRESGLAYLFTLPSEADAYWRFVNAFADKLVRAQNSNPLRPAEGLPPLADIHSAFHDPQTQLQRVVRDGPPGRRVFVQFVFVAARAEELGHLRQELSAYGELGVDWQPYLPPLEKEVDMIANGVALREGYRYDAMRTIDEGLVQQIREAAEERKVVVVIVDAWTVRLEHYQRLMRQLDDYNLPSCVVIVPVNRGDAETARCEEALRATLEATFVNRHLAPDPDMFVTWVDSPEALEERLARALGTAKMRIIQRYEVTRRARSEGGPARLPLIAGSDRANTA